MIIFDCDGVLVDSEILSNAIDAELMTTAGWPITAAEIIRGHIGQPKAVIWDQIAALRGAPWPEGLIQEADALLLARMETELQPVEGIRAALERLPGRKAVASSSALPKLRRSLEICGLSDFFAPHIYSASQVARGKPFPDVFLFAASQCGVDPADCVVVEDSAAGVKAALAAGMRVAGLTAGRHSWPGHGDQLLAAGAARIFTRTSELTEAALRAL
ncbi:HAD family phosphatase [Rhodobacter sp. 24-YEA-8]|uniref:HAD family hydrolase n=1 Tax=Rhodobacter sp. 24-YEA-8 TaxID=1884310 RepID=UPI00089439F8|nr:HAD-IA family hydrolase [Rhodobacter sp. 24-YEA-8]SED72051.1 haloacid dehalogenase superfamily, subfamily IA, variant 3 with third motif having DD or ED [Rhodobacter sp. 24-YEA-8]